MRCETNVISEKEKGAKSKYYSNLKSSNFISVWAFMDQSLLPHILACKSVASIFMNFPTGEGIDNKQSNTVLLSPVWDIFFGKSMLYFIMGTGIDGLKK